MKQKVKNNQKLPFYRKFCQSQDKIIKIIKKAVKYNNANANQKIIKHLSKCGCKSDAKRATKLSSAVFINLGRSLSGKRLLPTLSRKGEFCPFDWRNKIKIQLVMNS